MRHAGLTVRDAISIERTTLKRNGHGFWKLYLYRGKTGHPVECLLHPSVMTEILANANPEGSRYLFVDSWPKKEDDGAYTYT